MLTNTRKKQSMLTSVQKYKPKARKKACRLFEIVMILLVKDIVLFLKRIFPRQIYRSKSVKSVRQEHRKELEQLIITSAIVRCVSIRVFVLYVLFTSGKRKIYSFIFLWKAISTAENVIPKKWPSTNPEW